MAVSWGGDGERFRTASPASRVVNGRNVIDSYTGIMWCGDGLHLLADGNVAPDGGCRPCATRKRRIRRRSKR